MQDEILELIYEDNKQAYEWLKAYDCYNLLEPENMHDPIRVISSAQIEEMLDFFEKKTFPDKPGHYTNKIRNITSIFSSIEYYLKIEQRAARLFLSIIGNHIFEDGNKRVACFILNWYLSYHGLQDCLSPEILLLIAIHAAQAKCPAERDLMYIPLLHVFMNQSHHKHAMKGICFSPNTHSHKDSGQETPDKRMTETTV